MMQPEPKIPEAIAEQILEKVEQKARVPSPLWTVEDIAYFLKLSPRHVKDRVIKTPGFPAAVPVQGAGRRPTLRWRSEDIVRWARPKVHTT